MVYQNNIMLTMEPVKIAVGSEMLTPDVRRPYQDETAVGVLAPRYPTLSLLWLAGLILDVGLESPRLFGTGALQHPYRGCRR